MPPTRKTNRDRQDEFIAEFFANGCRKEPAARKLGMSYSQVKKWFAEDVEFRERVDEFREMWKEHLRAVAYKRATEKSDTLLIFLLKSLEPETYDDAVRNAKYFAANNLQQEGFIPVRAVLVRDAEPAGVKVTAPAAEQEH